MNIPGLAAPTWSRLGAGSVDEESEAEAELTAAKLYKKQLAQGKFDVKFSASSASSSSTPASLTCDLFVLACGMVSSSFLSALIGNDVTELGRFTMLHEDDSALGKEEALILVQSKAAPSIVFGLNYTRTTAVQYAQLTQALFGRVTAKEVLLLDTIPQGSFISSERPLPCPPILRRLQTAYAEINSSAAASSSSSSAAPASAAVPNLEQPNMVFGYSASVLTHCEVSQLPCQLYVSVESRHYIVEGYQAFEGLFTATPTSASYAPLRSLAQPFLTSNETARTKAYKSAAATLQRTHNYATGSDSNIRETAALTQRDHRDAMFY